MIMLIKMISIYFIPVRPNMKITNFRLFIYGHPHNEKLPFYS